MPESLSKQEWRETIWDRMIRRRVALFPGAKGRIPNFRGAREAALLLAATPAWRRACTLKSNPDAPQRWVRYQALKEGKRVYMAVPRLRESACFVELDPARLGPRLYEASSIHGAFRYGKEVRPASVPPIDLVVAGSVVVNHRGERIGKGGGYSDLEFALGREWDFIGAGTRIATTVHPLQVVGSPLPRAPWDFLLDLIVTPSEVIAVKRRGRQPGGILWEALSPAQIQAMPVLSALRRRKGKRPPSR